VPRPVTIVTGGGRGIGAVRDAGSRCVAVQMDGPMEVSRPDR
jgi:hypothetical protein